MLNRLKNIILFNARTVAGLHLFIDSDGKNHFYYVALTKKKQVIDISKQSENSCELSELTDSLPPNCPVCLSVDGKGILHKQIDSIPSVPILQQVIPNSSESDFIYEVINGEHGRKYVSVARRNLIDDLLDTLKEHNINVIALTINPLSCIDLIKFFPDIEMPLVTGSLQLMVNMTSFEVISISRGNAESIESSNLFGSTKVSSSVVTPFSSAFCYLLNEPYGVVYEPVVEKRNEYLAKNIFNLAGVGMLIILLLVLLINMFSFLSLSDKKQQLEMQIQGNTDILSKIHKIEDEISWKEKYTGHFVKMNGTWFSFIADRIGASVPQDISLTRLELQPVISKIISSKEIELKQNVLKLEGVAKSSITVNYWVQDLKKIQGIDNVVIESYSVPENKSYGIFSLVLSTKDFVIKK